MVFDPKLFLVNATKFPLTSREVKMLQKSWERVKGHFGSELHVELTKEMVERCPDLLSHFGLSGFPVSAALADHRLLRHGLLLRDTLDLMMADLSTNNMMLAGHLTTFGSQHDFYTRRGLDPEAWLAFGSSFLTLLAQVPFRRNHLKAAEKEAPPRHRPSKRSPRPPSARTPRSPRTPRPPPRTIGGRFLLSLWMMGMWTRVQVESDWRVSPGVLEGGHCWGLLGKERARGSDPMGLPG